MPTVARCACGGGCPRCRGRGEGGNEPGEPVASPELATGEEASAQPAQAGGTPAAVASIRANIGTSATTLPHVPACGNQPTIRFTAAPAGAAPITWALAAGSAQVAAGTALASPAPPAGSTNPAAATLDADLSLGAAQTGGTLDVSATNSQGAGQVMSYTLASHPTGITSTSAIGNPTNATDYGGVFDHVFTSNDARVASLGNVAVGERFPNLANPTTATHVIANTPFGSFTLTTGTLPDTASAASGNWFLTSAGMLGGTHDNVTIQKTMIDIGRHLASDSNPTPAFPLPAGFTVDQEFHWWCPHAASGSRWTQFAATTHTRRLRLSATGTAEFVAIVNSQENAIPYEGRTGVRNAQATPVTVAPSPGGAAAANTVQITAETFPSGRQLHFSITGAALGCTIDATTGVLTIGAQTGAVTVRAADSRGGPNWDEVQVTIAVPPPPVPSPSPNPNPAPPPGSTSLPESTEPEPGAEPPG